MTNRRSASHETALRVQCRLRAGGVVELDLLDLSAGGCMVRFRGGADVGDRVLVRLPGLGFQPAAISWLEDGLAGIGFEQPLHEAVLDHLSVRLAQQRDAA
jgi:hypothetical protein